MEHTKKVIINGIIIESPKKAYDTDKQAIAEARSLNLSEKQIHKAIAYKCSICHKWYIGKSNKVLTEKDVKKYKHLSLLEK